jgi:hypothetical protein
MLQVDNFLFVFSLEVGGKFMGMFGIVTQSIVLPLSFVALIGICIDKDLKFIRQKLDEMEIPILTTDGDSAFDETAYGRLREYFIMWLILVLIVSSINLIASVLLLRGTKNVRTQLKENSKNENKL